MQGNSASGDACKICKSVLVAGFPDVKWADAGRDFHDKSKKEFKQQFLAAKAVWLKVQEELGPAAFSPMSSVTVGNLQAVTTYYEAAFLTETDVVRLTGLASKALKLGNATTITLEDGVSTLNGFLVSLRGFNPSEAFGVRKIRFESKTEIKHAEHLLDASRQIRQGQGDALFRVAAAGQVDLLDSKMTPKNRVHLPDLEGLRKKATQIIEAWWLPWHCTF